METLLTCDLNDSQESTDYLSDEVNYAHTHSELTWVVVKYADTIATVN